MFYEYVLVVTCHCPCSTVLKMAFLCLTQFGPQYTYFLLPPNTNEFKLYILQELSKVQGYEINNSLIHLGWHGFHDYLNEAPVIDSFTNSHSQWDTFGFTLLNMGCTVSIKIHWSWHKIQRLEVNNLLYQDLLEAHI